MFGVLSYLAQCQAAEVQREMQRRQYEWNAMMARILATRRRHIPLTR